MSRFEKSNDKGKTGLTRRDFLETAGLTTLAIGVGGMAMPPTA
ncbi:twin-arginine translocation signal domain-containing protein [Photobacterium sagamiensis]